MLKLSVPVFGLWLLTLLEALLFAAVPGFIATAIDHGGAAWWLPVVLFVLGVVVLTTRNMLDTRVYVGMWRDKICELFIEDRASARAKAGRWNDALKRLEQLGPHLLRGGTDLIVGLVYIAMVSPALAGLTLLACGPCVVVNYWVTKRTMAIADELNALAHREAAVYDNGTEYAADSYYRDQYRLTVAESDADAWGYPNGHWLFWVLRFGGLFVLQQHGVSAPVLFAVLLYSTRFADGVDRVTLGLRNLSVVLTIIKV